MKCHAKAVDAVSPPATHNHLIIGAATTHFATQRPI